MKPKCLLITLVFDDDNLNQNSVIDLAGMETLNIDQVPIIEEANNIIGSNKKLLKELKFLITVGYGQGLELNETDNLDTTD